MHQNDCPLFSVVLIHFNQEQYWRVALDSIIGQDYPAIQIIFTDDASECFNSGIVQSYIESHNHGNIVDVHFVANKTNRGTVATFNSADELCTGEYILHLAADDALAGAGVLSAFAKRLESENDLCGVFGRVIWCDADLNPLPNVDTPYTDEHFEQLGSLSAAEQFRAAVTRGYNIFPMGGTAFRSTLYRKATPIPEENRFIEDWPFSINATYEGCRFSFEHIDSLLYREGGITRTAVEEYTPRDKRVRQDHARVYEAYIFAKDLATRLTRDEIAAIARQYSYARAIANQWVEEKSPWSETFPLKPEEFDSILETIVQLTREPESLAPAEAATIGLNMVEGLPAKDRAAAFGKLLKAFDESSLFNGLDLYIEGGSHAIAARDREKKLEQKAASLQYELDCTSRRLDETLNSTTWKVGSLIMYVPCKLKKLLAP